MSASSPARSTNTIRFFAQHYHFLKGWCYLPAGVLLLVGTLALAFLRPDWLTSMGGLVMVGISVALTAPWMWHMHQRYEDRYGRVRTPDDHPGGHPLTGSNLSAPEFIGILFAALLWIAVCFIYIPKHTVIQDNHFLPLFAGYHLVLRSLRPPNRTTRIVYLTGALPLVAATLLPLVYPDPWTVALANYGGLGAVTAIIGGYNHHLLTDTFGPLDADADSADELAPTHA